MILAQWLTGQLRRLDPYKIGPFCRNVMYDFSGREREREHYLTAPQQSSSNHSFLSQENIPCED